MFWPFFAGTSGWDAEEVHRFVLAQGFEDMQPTTRSRARIVCGPGPESKAWPLSAMSKNNEGSASRKRETELLPGEMNESPRAFDSQRMPSVAGMDARLPSGFSRSKLGGCQLQVGNSARMVSLPSFLRAMIKGTQESGRV